MWGEGGGIDVKSILVVVLPVQQRLFEYVERGQERQLISMLAGVVMKMKRQREIKSKLVFIPLIK